MDYLYNLGVIPLRMKFIKKSIPKTSEMSVEQLLGIHHGTRVKCFSCITDVKRFAVDQYHEVVN